MILAGIDEAGLGPVLGPLATGCAALAVPDGWHPHTPWEALGGVVSTTASKAEDGSALPVADSKRLYQSGAGLAAMERTLACFLRLAGEKGLNLAEPCYPGETIHECYCRRLASFPTECLEAAAALAAAARHAGCGLAGLWTAWLFEPEFNRRCREGCNKNRLLLLETGRHLATLDRAFPNEIMEVVVDKQGGRNGYAPFLGELFPGLWIDTILEGAAESAYRVRRPGGMLTVRFRAKADRDSFPTALASMAAKYVRERAMAELNAWFAQRLPDVPPTAGYPTDARRWLAQVRASGQAKRLKVDLLIRCR